MQRRIHETASGSFIVYQGDCILYETDCRREAEQARESKCGILGAGRRQGTSRANGEAKHKFRARTARQTIALMHSGMASSRVGRKYRWCRFLLGQCAERRAMMNKLP